MAQQAKKKLQKPSKDVLENKDGEVETDNKDEQDTQVSDGGDFDPNDPAQNPHVQAPANPTHVSSMLSDNGDVDPDTDWGSLPGAPTDGGIVLGPDEPIRIDGELDQYGTSVTLNKAVYRAHRPMGSKRWAFTLVYPKGHQIPQSMVQRMQAGNNQQDEGEAPGPANSGDSESNE